MLEIMMFRKPLAAAALTSALVMGIAASPGPAEACSRILWNDNGFAVMVGRTMDWPESTQPILTVFPRGLQRDGGKAGAETVVAENPARWTTKYGSVVTTVYGVGTADGMNEKGLAVHMLYLKATDFGARDKSKKGLQAGLWGQYMLDNAATVKEALKLFEGIQPVMISANGHKATLHLAMEDATGDSAIVEYIDGKPVIHHGREFRVMTNDPTYAEQLELLKKQDFSKPSSTIAVPGNVNAIDRFQRATYYLSNLSKPANDRQAAASILAVARNVSVPFGSPYKGFGLYDTEYRTAANLSNRTYFFELTTSPSVIWVNLSAMNLEAGQPVRVLNPDNIELSGNVIGSFRAAPAPF
jgi:penicillin V acylase-like amidase (Ntn superfamily)